MLRLSRKFKYFEIICTQIETNTFIDTLKRFGHKVQMLEKNIQLHATATQALEWGLAHILSFIIKKITSSCNIVMLGAKAHFLG